MLFHDKRAMPRYLLMLRLHAIAATLMLMPLFRCYARAAAMLRLLRFFTALRYFIAAAIRYAMLLPLSRRSCDTVFR